jgi:hypothetical protein
MQPRNIDANEQESGCLSSLGCDVPNDNPLRAHPWSERTAIRTAEDWVLAIVTAGVVFPAATDHHGTAGYD